MFQETSLLKFHKQMNSREVSKYNRPLWVSIAYIKGGHMTQKRKNVVSDMGTGKGKTETINFDEIGITNDFMFGTVFRDKEKCKELLQRILQIKLIEIEVVEPQKSMKTTFIGKGIRIDIYAKDSDGNVYDIEMQTTDIPYLFWCVTKKKRLVWGYFRILPREKTLRQREVIQNIRLTADSFR